MDAYQIALSYKNYKFAKMVSGCFEHKGYIFIEGRTIPSLFKKTANIDSDYHKVIIGESIFSYNTKGYYGVD